MLDIKPGLILDDFWSYKDFVLETCDESQGFIDVDLIDDGRLNRDFGIDVWQWNEIPEAMLKITVTTNWTRMPTIQHTMQEEENRERPPGRKGLSKGGNDRKGSRQRVNVLVKKRAGHITLYRVLN
jgi:hypothetical protein